MGLTFSNYAATTQILVNNPGISYPAHPWEANSTLKNWWWFNSAERKKKQFRGNGQIPIQYGRPRHFMLINFAAEKSNVDIVWGGASTLTTSLFAMASFVTLLM